MIVEGPGVTPDVKWEGRGLVNFDPSNPIHVAHEQTMNTQLDSLNDNLCSPPLSCAVARVGARGIPCADSLPPS